MRGMQNRRSFLRSKTVTIILIPLYNSLRHPLFGGILTLSFHFSIYDK